MLLEGTLLGLYAGQPSARWPDKPASAIDKSLIKGPVVIQRLGIAQDQQADVAVHGGPDKALHHYPADHYAAWAAEFSDTGFSYVPGVFGENISVSGLTEEDLHIGDILRAGTATVQISQGRQPCWKLNMHTKNPQLAARFQKTGKTGWYYRVLEEGRMEAGDTMKMIDRPCPEWPMAKLIEARFNPRLDPATAQALADLEVMAENWREAFAKKTDPDFREDTSRRLPGS